MLLVFMVRYG
jgi:hypothetical protein